MSFWTQKRVWIIGASSGIGEGLLQILAEKGAKLIISARNESRLLSLKAGFPNSEITVIPIDVEQVFELSEKTEEAWETF